jgi:hypothetical protein
MSLQLTFINGVVRGTGSDRVGDFTMAGTYDLKTGNCSILKAYHGAHGVTYDGRNEGDGMWIWGLWTIRLIDRGGFHLWPAGEEDPTGRKRKAEQDLPAAQPPARLPPVQVPEPALAPGATSSRQQSSLTPDVPSFCRKKDRFFGFALPFEFPNFSEGPVVEEMPVW